MRFDRYGTLSFSLNIGAAKVAPYEYNWFQFASSVPMGIQAFPTKWKVAEGVTQGALKTRIFISSSALYTTLGHVTSGLHGLTITWLVEVVKAGAVTTYAYIGTVTQVNDVFFVIECAEYLGDVTKINP